MFQHKNLQIVHFELYFEHIFHKVTNCVHLCKKSMRFLLCTVSVEQK